MKETVLVVCEDNAILSQMAEAYIRRYGCTAFDVYSAGIERRPVHLYTLQVMEEIGYDLYSIRSKSIFELNHLQRVDYLITLSDDVNDQFVFNEQNIGAHLHWSYQNPLISPGQAVDPFFPRQDTFPEGWQVPAGFLLATKQRVKSILELPIQDHQHMDVSEVKNRFRKVRDLLEVQVMNWLEEKGIGPLWWCR